MRKIEAFQWIAVLIAMLGLSYLANDAANSRQMEITRSVILIDTELVNKEYHDVAYTEIKGVFYEPSMQKKFTASIDDPLYVSFMSGGKKPIEIRRAFSLDTIDGTFAGPLFRAVSIIILGYLIFTLIQLGSLQNRFTPLKKTLII